jgi:hypothetical protein
MPDLNSPLSPFEKVGLDEDAFGDKGGLSALRTFDAFRMYLSCSRIPVLMSYSEN